ncbi:methylenetetrahydrofolate--tRNA-(uracil(54)-C(5))-methyltransferase (FADH(2)-oxidizing) TrmFO [Desulfovibrio sp. 86]|uniref:Methylenetetrahydrofolate--tRNA-(uracil-5-)-methyltransferase TrmFO n=1 Tax=uncultured Desulfovibrio sp. TaxID=167968 RepID=A0A212L8B5_9BACT|nr:methylenetetrahydrofolate--tRNA-(uracil(54)-C(5))-methyltransferase (FADH(2)-oxidizing) TrmFO [Desulfovibrio sp. 86]SCM73745.1 Methylenetetrahydrofolate--tRNA-(uracil-5-)-methyltransferase TrmFO [uncultured Desulfovibrio sp.]VZH34394.1 Methylenetetrahydrofolate--tRNA-(uracil-5-)-methyltransferase TrmFO [Desulfovibrio sp. 86]
MQKLSVALVGGGLAGCECALRLARSGHEVVLFEQKPLHRSPAHVNDNLAELVCSNSLRSDELTSGVGLLKAEMRALGSRFMEAADACRVPAGKALAVDREAFARQMSQLVESEGNIRLVRHQVQSLDDTVLAPFRGEGRAIVVAAGPMASDGLSASLAGALGEKHCYFYDAIAPIVWTHSLNMDVVFRASRYGQENGEGEGDYLNCPMSREEYDVFYQALLDAQKVAAHEFEQEKHFEGCMPVEALAERGPRTLTFGPLKPVGFVDPRTGRRPWAIVQLRAENANSDTCNLVGCQTKLTQGEQARVFRLVPGLEKVEFARFGSMHRNTYVNAPQVLAEDLSLNVLPGVFLAGQITGVEGYVESAASGLWLALLLDARARGARLPTPPAESALGALINHLRTPVKRFQPSNAHFGLMPELGERARKKDRKALYSARAQEAFGSWLQEARAAGLV